MKPPKAKNYELYYILVSHVKKFGAHLNPGKFADIALACSEHNAFKNFGSKTPQISEFLANCNLWMKEMKKGFLIYI